MLICHLEAYLTPVAEFLGVGVCIKVTFLENSDIANFTQGGNHFNISCWGKKGEF